MSLFLAQLGLEVVPSSTNFILFRFDPKQGHQHSRHQIFCDTKYSAQNDGALWAW